MKNAAFSPAGTSVTSVTAIREWSGRVTLLMDIYSIVKLEPCDTVTEVTKARILSEKCPWGIVNAVLGQILLSQDVVTEVTEVPYGLHFTT